MKTCTKCGHEKHFSEFYKKKDRPLGLTSACKACFSKRPRKALYDLWRGMLARCYEPTSLSYSNYGAKGIGVCDRWRESVDAFLTDMGERPDGTTLDRIDSSADYSPGNCRWATITQQNNNKSNVRHITWNGRTQNMTAWAEELGMSASTLHQRLTEMNLTVDQAFTIPVTRLDRKGRFGNGKNNIR